MASNKINSTPEGFHSVTAQLVVRDAPRAMEFYRKAFGATERMRFPGPDGTGIMYAELQIGDSVVSLTDEMPMMQYWVSPAALNGTSVALVMYVADADALFHRAVAAGATVSLPMMDMFWGDRYGRVRDPFGHEWVIACKMEDLTPEEIGKRAQVFFASMSAGHKP